MNADAQILRTSGYETRAVSELSPGMTALFDPVRGPERIISIAAYTLGNGVACQHLNVGGQEGYGHFLVRGSHERVIVTALPIFIREER